MSTRPDYVDFDPKSRDELLSQIGTFSPVERSLFGRLCEAWEPRIDAERFLRGATGADQESAALRRLMSKLRGSQLGLLTMKPSAHGLVPDVIILTTRGSLDFWREAIAEETMISNPEARLSLPSERKLAERKLTPPAFLITDIDSTQLAKAHAGEIDGTLLTRFRLLDDFKILFAASSARLMINQGFATLRKDIEERGIMEELARVRDTSLTEMRAQLQSKNPEAWLQNSRALVKERATIAYRKNIEQSDEIFQMAYLVMSFVDARLGLAKQTKEDHAAVSEEIKALVEKVARATDGGLSQQEFEQAVTEAENRLGPHGPAFTTQLEEKVFQPKKRRALAVLTLLYGRYIHQDRLASLFEHALGEAKNHLTEEYCQLLEAYLRGRDSDITEILGSRARLDQDIAERLQRVHPLLSEILHRPQALAEAMVRSARRKGQAESPEAIREILSRYFEVDDSRIKPLHAIIGLDVSAAFDAAYSRLSVIRQLLLRISGRYESLRSSYSNRFGPPKKRIRYNESLPGTADRGGVHGAHTSGKASRRGSSVRKVATPQKPKAKSAKEIEELWQEFGKALNTKNND